MQRRPTPRAALWIITLSLLASCATPAPAPKPEEDLRTMKMDPSLQIYDETTPAGAQLSWVLKHLNTPSSQVPLEELEQHFDATFKAQVPPAQLQQVFAQLSAAYGPFTLTEAKANQPDTLVVQAKTKTDELWLISIAVAPQAPHAITGLLFKPDPTVNEESLPKSWNELEEQLKQGAARPSLYAAKIDAGQCQQLHAVRGDEQQALGSTFKLYILGALAQQIDEGKLTWEQEIPIKEALKSLPSGVLQNKAAGEKVTIKEAASKMIAISDNTATDHLLDLVGRDKVEAWVKLSGHSTPARMMPFMSTREMFQIKLGHDDAWRTAYVAKSEPERRKVIQELSKQPLPALESASGWDKPRNVDTIEWFASGKDLCALHATFIKHKERPAFKTALEIMTLNKAGLTVDLKDWPYIGYKGGSEPGVLFMSFLLQDAQGAWYSINIGGSDDERAQDAAPYVGFATAIVKNILAKP